MKKNVRVVTSITVKKQFCDQFINPVTTEQLDDLTDGQYSKNSLLAQTKDWNLFSEFCRRRNVTPLPASTTAVRLYLERESKSRKYATIKRYAVTIGLIHRTLNFSDPTTQVKVRECLASLRMQKHQDADSTVAFERKHLESLTTKLMSSKSSKDIRNLAIYHVMFECLLKRSELRNLDCESHYRFVNERAVILIGNNHYTLSSLATHHLLRWLAVRGDSSGPLFHAIDKYGNLSARRLDDSSIYRIMRSASDILGLDINFSGQSLRVGSAQEMANKGVRTVDIQQYGRWLSAAMPYQYIGNRAKAASERLTYKAFKPWD